MANNNYTDITKLANATFNQYQGVQDPRQLQAYQQLVNEDAPLQDTSLDVIPFAAGLANTFARSTAPGLKAINEFVDPNSYYRVVHGKAAADDIMQNGLVRVKKAESAAPAGKISLNRGGTTPYPSFAKGSAAMEYAKSNPENYIIVTNKAPMQASTLGRHGAGTTQFPIDELGKYTNALDAGKVQLYKHEGDDLYSLLKDYQSEGLASKLTNLFKR